MNRLNKLVGYLAKQFGMMALGACIIASTVEVHDMFVVHEALEQERVVLTKMSLAYAIDSGADVKRLEVEIPENAIKPPPTVFNEIALKLNGGSHAKTKKH